jgi:two-component system cell cycle sensor histidine kinase PleC
VSGKGNQRVGVSPSGDAGDSARDTIVRLAHVSHELRTPLGAIAILAEILRDERLGPLGNSRYRSYAADIHDCAVHASSVVAALVDPSGRRGTAAPLVFVELDLLQLVKSTISAVSALAEQSGVKIEQHLPAALPRLITDGRAVRQMLDNLIANAVKFTPPGGSVSISVSYAAGGPVRIEVADTGDGMSGSELAAANAEGAMSEPLRRRSGGTGLGLPLVRSLAAACGAVLRLESALGQGTRATLEFGYGRVVPV